jgi:hypothetical protein
MRSSSPRWFGLQVVTAGVNGASGDEALLHLLPGTALGVRISSGGDAGRIGIRVRAFGSRLIRGRVQGVAIRCPVPTAGRCCRG